MPELIGKLQATFKNTLHPSQKWCKYLCMSCFGRVKSALASSPLFTTLRNRYFWLSFNPFSNSSMVGIDDLKSFGKSLES